MSRALIASFASLWLGVGVAHAQSTSEISQETARTVKGGARAATFFWLPVEYWVASARESGAEPEKVERVRALFRDYLMIGVVDVEIDADGTPRFKTIADVVRRTRIERDGQVVPVLREVNPDLARLAPDLVYVLRKSLGFIGDGLRLLPLSNVNDEGERVISAAREGEVEVEFRFELDSEAHVLVWRAPLTSIVGPQRCPVGAEELDAAWKFCPYHGARLPGRLLPKE